MNARLDEFMYRLADRIPKLSDGKVVICIVIGYLLALMHGWLQ